jgi:GMP synthase-like glutamine amidotransferase
MESHCGQIEWPPAGWMLTATAGEGTKTKTQCLRVKDRYIYAAQFHIEMAGTPGNSRRIMGNFLALAKAWGGYNPGGKDVVIPPDSVRKLQLNVAGWQGTCLPVRKSLAVTMSFPLRFVREIRWPG